MLLEKNVKMFKGIKIITEDAESTSIAVGGGEVWHDFVLWSIHQNLSGIENLALIPGLVGASPIQNIGAYGEEISSKLTSVDVIDMKTFSEKTISQKGFNLYKWHFVNNFKDNKKRFPNMGYSPHIKNDKLIYFKK